MIVINIDKAKVIAHAKRRMAREVEFAPHDEIISKQIPSKDAQAAEAARMMIREKYAVMQLEIDNAVSVDEIKQALSNKV